VRDFWLSCGHHLLDRHDGGGLAITDEFLKLYLARPELAPPPDACVVERTLHAALLADPRRPVDAAEIAAIADADARENFELLVAWRDHLLNHPTIEAAYLALVRQGAGKTPPLFLNQLVHAILRNALDGCDDPFVLRAGELFFRPQRIMPHGQSLLLADEEIIGGRSPTPVLSLMSMLGAAADAEVDVLSDENAESYWRRSDQFDMGLGLTGGGRAAAALAEAMRRWISHLLGIDVAIEPLTELRNERWTWYVGLDSEATGIGDRLWHGETLDAPIAGRVLALFRLTFADPVLVAYLILAVAPDQVLRMKPQNLLTGLPIKHLEAVS